MTISVPTSIELVATNVTDSTPVFNEATDYNLNDIVLYDLGETHPSVYIKSSNASILDYHWTDIISDGDVVRASDNSIHIANQEIGVFQNRGISDVYAAPTFAQLLSQGTYTVGSFKFQGVWKGTYPAMYFAVRIKDLSDVTIDEAPLYYINESRTKLIPPYPDGSLAHPEAMIYDNNTIYFTSDRVIDPINDNQFDAFVSGTDSLDILGFTKYLDNEALLPFDGKNYTIAEATTTMTYTVKGLVKFDTLALGRVKADNVAINFKNSIGTIITTINEAIDSSRDDLGNLEDWYTTAIYYSDSVMEVNSTVEITLTGANIELGNLMLGMSVDAGMTLLTMKHGFKDYSVLETDIFGNETYIERASVNRFSGSVDIKTTDYDRNVRLLTSIGKNLVIVNGSDSNNKAPNGVSIWRSTQMIGRFDSFEQKTATEDGEVKEFSRYAYSFKEIV